MEREVGESTKGPIIDNLIKKAADEISQQDWPGLWDIDPTDKQIELARKIFEGTDHIKDSGT